VSENSGGGVAVELFRSSKTVETRLRNTFRQLGVATRAWIELRTLCAPERCVFLSPGRRAARELALPEIGMAEGD